MNQTHTPIHTDVELDDTQLEGIAGGGRFEVATVQLSLSRPSVYSTMHRPPAMPVPDRFAYRR